MTTTVDARSRRASITGGPPRLELDGPETGARRSVRGSVAISAIRCVLTYLVIPALTPLLGWFDGVATPVSLVLSLVAVGFAVTGLRRVRRAEGRGGRGYTAFVALVLVALALVIGFDVRELLT